MDRKVEGGEGEGREVRGGKGKRYGTPNVES